MFENLVEVLKANPRKIVYTEGTDARILESAARLKQGGFLTPILVGNVDDVKAAAKAGSFDIEGLEIIDPANYDKMDEMAQCMFDLRKGKMTMEEVRANLQKGNYFGTMLVKMGVADALLGGATYSTADTVRPALQLIKTKKGAHLVSSCFIMVRGDEMLAMGDCAINIDYQDTVDKATGVLPLAGVRVGLVGTPAFTERLARRLEALGAAAVPCMTARVRPLPPQPGWERLADGRSCWVVLTSRNGVGCFFDALAAARIDVRRLHACRFAAIGPATAEALAQRGITADLCPEQATGAELARALCATAGPGEEILLFRAAESSPEMRGILTAQGFSVREYTLYKTEYAAASPNAEADYLAFASAGGVRAWFSACGAAPKGAVCVCIGPVTARALAQQTGAPFLTAEDISAEGVAECILRAHRHKKAQEE